MTAPLKTVEGSDIAGLMQAIGRRARDAARALALAQTAQKDAALAAMAAAIRARKADILAANAQDLAKLQSAEGKPRWMVLLILGHPSAVQRRPDGVEIWDYPWVAACRVWFQKGACTATFYTGGY